VEPTFDAKKIYVENCSIGSKRSLVGFDRRKEKEALDFKNINSKIGKVIMGTYEIQK